MFRLPEKGTIDYLNKKKKMNLMMTIFCFLAVIIIYATGLIIYKNNRSVYTVIAAVAALPAAKALLSFIMVAPYKPLSKDQVAAVKKTVEGKLFQVLYDLVITSEEKAMQLSLVLIYSGHILIYSSNPKQNDSELEAYIKKIVTCKYSSIKVYNDLNELLKRAESISHNEKGENNSDDIIRRRLIAYGL